jgi:hypothetical protein
MHVCVCVCVCVFADSDASTVDGKVKNHYLILRNFEIIIFNY